MPAIVELFKLRFDPTLAADRQQCQQQIAKQIGAHLKQQEIRLAAVDVIAGWVTDFNFTSPGLLPAMEVLEGKNLAREVIRALAPEQRL